MSDQPGNKLFLETFGCQMNFLDSELVIGQFRRLGFEVTADRERADVILFNTCSVRDHAEQKVTSRLGELRQLKADRPGVVIGVIGCQAEREGRGLIGRFPHVDILCGPDELARLGELVASVRADRKRAIALSGGAGGRRGRDAADDERVESLDRSRSYGAGESPLQAYVRVQRGCDKFCAFCVVPAVRGRERCRPPENILDEVRMLARAGCREVTLLGQTVNSYRQQTRDGQPADLAWLLRQVAAVEGLLRVRFVTNYPGDFDEGILRAMAETDKVCPYLHIPAQSGSDRILRAMRRRYSADDYFRLIDRARQVVPDLSLAGDFIVGFPGETDADFAASEQMVRRVGYKNCFVFKYSPRPGTLAARAMPDDVPDAVKRQRNNHLLAVQAEISSRANAALIGSTVRILVEGASKQGGSDGQTDSGSVAGQLVGRTTGDQIVVFAPPVAAAADGLVGRLADIRVTQVTPTTLIGELVGAAEAGRAGPGATPLRYKSLSVLR